MLAFGRRTTQTRQRQRHSADKISKLRTYVNAASGQAAAAWDSAGGASFTELIATAAELQVRMRMHTSEEVGHWLSGRLTKLGTTYVKIGQFMSSRQDIFGAEFCKPLATLRDRVPPMPGAEARSVLEAYPTISARLSGIDWDAPIASASIGQVYRGILHRESSSSGGARERRTRQVVVKIRRPGIEANIERDIAILDGLVNVRVAVEKWLPGVMASSSASGVTMQQTRRSLQEFRTTLMYESDFLREARTMREFRNILGSMDGKKQQQQQRGGGGGVGGGRSLAAEIGRLLGSGSGWRPRRDDYYGSADSADDGNASQSNDGKQGQGPQLRVGGGTIPRVIVPYVHLDMCRPDILVMDYVPGVDVETASRTLPPVASKRLSTQLMETFVVQLVHCGLVHGDPHPGNMGITAKGDLVLYDFGCAVRITGEERHALKSLIWQLVFNDMPGVIASLRNLGAEIYDAEGVKQLIGLYRKYMQTVDVAIIRRDYDPSQPLPLRLPDKIMQLSRVYGMLEGTCKSISPDFNYTQLLMDTADSLLMDEEFLARRASEDVNAILTGFFDRRGTA